MQEEKQYGFFSKRMCSTLMGSHSRSQSGESMAVVYSTPDGGELVVTVVGSDPIKAPTSWGDEVALGEVSEYMRAADPAEIVKAHPDLTKALFGIDPLPLVDLAGKLFRRSVKVNDALSDGGLRVKNP